MSSSESQQRVDQFLQWFRDLDLCDQDELMTLVYSEHKIREVVRSFSAMPADQRKSVFQRLGLPNDLLNRIPPPATNTDSEIDVEWKDWDNANAS